MLLTASYDAWQRTQFFLVCLSWFVNLVLFFLYNVMFSIWGNFHLGKWCLLNGRYFCTCLIHSSPNLRSGVVSLLLCFDHVLCLGLALSSRFEICHSKIGVKMNCPCSTVKACFINTWTSHGSLFPFSTCELEKGPLERKLLRLNRPVVLPRQKIGIFIQILSRWSSCLL